MQKWKCVSIGDGTWDFELNRVYKLKRDGSIDDDGNLRASPLDYNVCVENGDDDVPYFVKVPTQLENK